MPSPAPSTRALASAALATVAAFPLLVLVLNVVQLADGYEAGRQAMSELALGREGWLMAVAFLSLATGTALTGLLLRRGTGATVVPLLLAVAAALTVVSAFVHTDPTGGPVTTHGQVHDGAGIATFLALLLATVLASVRFRRLPAWRRIAAPSAALAVLGVVAFLLVPVLGDARFGIAQRLLVGTFLVWLLVVSAYARTLPGHPVVERATDGRTTARARR